MELLCPECLGPLVSRDGRVATCTVHGGHFEILFSRHSLPAPAQDPSATPNVLTEGAACTQHPARDAAHACADCGKPICELCSFDDANGSHLCPACAQTRLLYTPLPVVAPQPQVPSGVHCVQHSNLAATAKCKICGGFMCDTCKFELPGGINICPTCAANPRTALTAKQTKSIIGSLVAAAWCTLVLGALFAGVFRNLAKETGGQQALGFIMMVFLIAPALLGVALAVGSMRRQQANPISIWIAIVWNGVILGGFLLLMIVGLLSKK